MAQDTQTTATLPIDPMAAFVSQHGVENVLSGLEAAQFPPKEAPVGSPPPPVPQPVTPEPQEPLSEDDEGEPGDDDQDIDQATLDALDQISEGEDKPSEGADDTTQSTVDPTILAKTLGLKPDDLVVTGEGIRVRAKVDGEEVTVPFGELQAGYQKHESYTRKSQAFLQQKEEWEKARQQSEQQAQQLVEVATQVLQTEEQQLDKEFTRDWSQLRQENPAEYAAQVAEYSQRKQQIQARKNQVVQAVQQVQQHRQQEQLKQMAEQQKAGRKVLAETLEWKPEEFESYAGRLRDFLVSEKGLTPQQVAMISDPRILISAERERQFLDLMKRVDASRKKVQKAGKVPRDTTARPAGQNKVQKLQKAQKRLKSSGTVGDFADVVNQLGINNV